MQRFQTNRGLLRNPKACRAERCRRRGKWALPVAVVAVFPPFLQAEIPAVLTDTLQKGSGVIDLMKDVSGSELSQYFSETGTLYLGVDLNENASGNESADSIGAAIKDLNLVLTTTDGVFTFNEFFTGTTAMILESGASSAQEFQTLFGTTGSNNITSDVSGFDLSSFDDVIEFGNISFTGEIVGAEINLTLLETADTGVEGNETFFDFSGGFEDFALLAESDATRLQDANLGVDDAQPSVSFTQVSDSSTLPPGAPLPPLPLMIALGVILLLRFARK